MTKKKIAKLAGVILGLDRTTKRLFALAVDFAICIFSVWLAFYLRLGLFVPLKGHVLWAVIGSVGIALPIFVISGLYRAIFRFSGWTAQFSVLRAVVVYGLLYASIFTAIGINDVPRTVGLIQPILLLLFIGLSRGIARLWLGDEYRGILRRSAMPRVLIYGAGSAGRQLALALSGNHEMRVVGFLDDDESLHGSTINGHPIYSPSDLPHLVTSQDIVTVLLAMPKIGRRRRNELLNQIMKVHIKVRTLPSLTDLAQGKLRVSDLRELDIDDLLGRDPVEPNSWLLKKNTTDKIVLVTGAGGSIGSELCRQVLAMTPKKLVLIEQNEYALYSILQELEERHPNQIDRVVPLLASVQDEARLRAILAAWPVDTIYHAAAYKHVPLVEQNVTEGVRNNVFGTLCMARVALEAGVDDFVLISTDKAVRPTNIMGASKRLGEMILQALAAANPRTRFSMVRFGNVLGSSGSVVPKFRKQIREGGPITLTHPEVTRYFMTVPEAAILVMQSGAMARGGEVFVLDMGEPVRIMDLAIRMIELSGLSLRSELAPEGDIEVKITGLRPGEKLYEELLIGDDPDETLHPRIMKANEHYLAWGKFEVELASLEDAINENDVLKIKDFFERLVSGYRAANEMVDWLYVERNCVAVNSDLVS